MTQYRNILSYFLALVGLSFLCGFELIEANSKKEKDAKWNQVIGNFNELHIGRFNLNCLSPFCLLGLYNYHITRLKSFQSQQRESIY